MIIIATNYILLNNFAQVLDYKINFLDTET